MISPKYDQDTTWRGSHPNRTYAITHSFPDLLWYAMLACWTATPNTRPEADALHNCLIVLPEIELEPAFRSHNSSI